LKKWMFDIYNERSEFVEGIFVRTENCEDAVEQAEWYVSTRKQRCWINSEQVKVESVDLNEDETRDLESDGTSTWSP
jgi:hypothetical protein